MAKDIILAMNEAILRPMAFKIRLTGKFNASSCTKRDELQEEEPKCIAPPPTAQTTGAIESIFWLEVHQADTNGATVAISEFPSQTGDIDHLLISAKVLILAIWSSFFWVLEGNSKIATVAPFIFTLCISSPKISPIAPTILAVGGCYTFQALLIL